MRLLPFIYSGAVAYKAQLGDQYARFFYRDQWVSALASPYADADVSRIHYRQLADVMWLTHPNYPQRKLKRISATDFNIEKIAFDKGPFLDENDTSITITPATDTPVVTSGQTYTASSIASTDWPASKTYDEISTGRNGWQANSGINQWVRILFSAGKTVVRLRIQPCIIQGYSWVKRCKIEASNDGIAWTKLPVTQWRGRCKSYNTDEIEIEAITNYLDWAEVVVTNTTSFTYYRLYCYNAWGTANIAVKEIEFYEAVADAYTASEPIFQPGHVGSLWKVRWLRTDDGITSDLAAVAAVSSSLVVLEGWKLVTYGDWIGTIKLQRSTDSGVTWVDVAGRVYKRAAAADLNWTDSGIEQEHDATYRIYMTARTSGTCTVNLSCTNPYYDSIVRVTQYVSEITVMVEQLTTLFSNAATKFWSEGAWSDVRGYPTSLTFFQGRIVYAGMTALDENRKEVRVWFSKSEDYDNFEKGNKDADSFWLVIPSVNEVRWVEALEGLFIGTASDEWRIYSAKTTETLTATNWTIKQISNYGSAAIQPVKINDAILFVDFPARKIRELLYDYAVDKHIARDLTVLAEHITLTGIAGIAQQMNPEPILWCCLNNGGLRSMTYEREQKVVAWSKHPIGGSGAVKSVCIVPDEAVGEDEVSLIVNRTINSEAVNYMERMAPRYFAEQKDAFFVDAGITKKSETAFTVVTGLKHLEGETLKVFGDGGVMATAVVSGGSIALPEAVNAAHAGLPFTYYLKPNRIVIPTRDGTSLGSIVHIPELVASFYQAMNVKYGRADDNLYDVDFPPSALLGSPPDFYTGDIVLATEGGFDTETTIIITGSDPVPCTVRAIIARMDKTGR